MCDDGNELLAFMTYDDKCPKILKEENKEEAEIAVEDYSQFAKNNFKNLRDLNNVCQDCTSKAWHRIQAEYIGIKHLIYPEESDHCVCMMRRKFSLESNEGRKL